MPECSSMAYRGAKCFENREFLGILSLLPWEDA